MGIPHFYKWLRNKGYREVLRRNVPKYVSSFSLDANGIIHQCAQLVYAYGDTGDFRSKEARKKLISQADPRMLEAEFYNVVSTKLHEIITQVNPQEILVIAIDGVAPQAKISQQRQRRFKTAMETKDVPVFDSNSITPGTDFMIRLDNYIRRWLISNQATLPAKVIYSSHMVPGEGEHKIIDLMRSGEISGDGSHVLYGMDADLIMLSLIAPIDRIFLMREDINDVIDIDSLKAALNEELKLPTAVNDFVVMSFTIGNDFLPHMPTLEDLDKGLHTLMNVYLETGRSLTTEDDLDWEGLQIFLNNVSKLEPSLLEEESSRDVKYPSRMLAVATQRTEKIEQGDVMTIGAKITFKNVLNYGVFRGAWYQNELLPKDTTSLSLIQALSPKTYGVTLDKVITMCQYYLKGLAWIYNYYTKGTAAISSDYVYRYNHTPLLTDIAGVLNQIKRVDGYMAQPNQVVLNPVHQLLSVLPLKSKSLLPKEVQHLMSKDSPISDMYPETAITEMDGKNADWQGLVIIPFVDPMRVIEAVNTQTMFTPERAQVYTQGFNIVMIRDPEAVEINAKQKGLRDFLDREKAKMGRGRGRGGYNRDNNRNNTGRGRGRGGYNRDNRDRDNRDRDNRDNRNTGGRGNNRNNTRDNRNTSRGRDNIPPSTGVFPTNMPSPTGVFPTNMPSPTGGFPSNMPPPTGGFPTNMPSTKTPVWKNPSNIF
jgi:5'-3' exoribonuclease 1